MSSRRRNRRSYRRRFGWWDGVLTVVFLGVLAWAVTLLDGHDPKSFAGRYYVVDGDTIIMDSEKLRLSGIDAPEMSQECTKDSKPWPCGRASRNALREFLRGKNLTCKTVGLDRYERWLATCFADRNEINKWMVESGWAVDYGGYGREEGAAKRAKSGLWSGQFENPEEWRRANRSDGSEMSVDGDTWISTPANWFKKLLN